MSERTEVSIRGLETTLARLEALPAEIVSKGGGPVRTALRKAALLIRDEMRKNVQAIMDEPNVNGEDDSTGTLRDSITVKRGKPHATLKGERYWVMVPKRKRYAPGGKSKSGIGVETVGQMLEYGTERLVEPKPWAGPAFHAKKLEATLLAVNEVNKGIEAVERKLARIKRR